MVKKKKQKCDDNKKKIAEYLPKYQPWPAPNPFCNPFFSTWSLWGEISSTLSHCVKFVRPIIVSLPIQQYDVLSTIKLSGWRSQLKTFKTLANAVFRTWRHGGPENTLHAIYLPNIFPREHFLLRASRSHFLRAFWAPPLALLMVRTPLS